MKKEDRAVEREGVTERESGGGYRLRGEIWNMEYFAEGKREKEGGKGRW